MDSGWKVVEDKTGPNDGLAIVCPVCLQCPVWAKKLYIITILLVPLVLYVSILFNKMIWPYTQNRYKASKKIKEIEKHTLSKWKKA